MANKADENKSYKDVLKNVSKLIDSLKKDSQQALDSMKQTIKRISDEENPNLSEIEQLLDYLSSGLTYNIGLMEYRLLADILKDIDPECYDFHVSNFEDQTGEPFALDATYEQRRKLAARLEILDKEAEEKYLKDREKELGK